MAASATTGLVYDIFKGVPVSVQVSSNSATVAPVLVASTPASTDQGLPGGLSVASATGIISGTPTGAASTNFGANFSAGVTGEGTYNATIRDTANSVSNTVTFRLHDAMPGEETDTATATPAAEENREDFYGQTTGG